MGFRIPLALLAGGEAITETFTTDTLIGDLYTYLGSPATARDIVLTVDGADIGNVIITLDFPVGTTFTINCINGGRVLGLGGNGGEGGADFGATGEGGVAGSNGGAAITSNTLNVTVNIDDGYLMGGGGGGGGGAYNDTGVGGTPGGGGGGGQGFSATTGGAAGSPTGVPIAIAGGAGGQSSFGAGGAGGTSGTNDGGDGGGWGTGGTTGDSTAEAYHGGVGGRAGAAFLPTNGATITFGGSKSEAVLISENRLVGEIDAGYPVLPNLRTNTAGGTGLSSTAGWVFLSTTGNLRELDSANGNTDFTDSWYGGTGSPTGSEYEVRAVTGHRFGSVNWGATGAAEGTWVALDGDRTWSITDIGPEDVEQLFEIRRTDTSRLVDSGFLRVDMESP